MALYAFDGTGNEDRDGDLRDTNVLDFFRAYEDPRANDDPDEDLGSLYVKGIGTRAKTLIGEAFSEAFGIGGHRRVRQALDRLENNVEDGDRTVDVVGFSRGAALALSFANEVARSLPRLSIRFLGLWDVVGQFGLPGRHLNAGHDLRMPRNVEQCYHAMALDEGRLLFPLTRLVGSRDDTRTTPVEVWFRGVHSDVGGGNGNRGLNWISLHWMYEAAKRQELPIATAAVDANRSDRDQPVKIATNDLEIGLSRDIRRDDLLHTSVDLGPAPPDRRHNNPRFPLVRVDDEGQMLSPAPAP